MKKGLISAAFAGATLLATQAAHAGFQFNYTVTPGVDALAGKNVFRFYAKNDQTGEQLNSKSLIAAQIHFQSLGGPLAFEFKDLNGDLVPDANVDGKDMTETDVKGTFVRIESTEFTTAAPWYRVFASPPPDSKPGVVPLVNYALVTDFYSEGAELREVTSTDRVDATQGLGRFYGAAVVPDDGTSVKVFGRVAAESGGIVGNGAPVFDDPAEDPNAGGPVAADPPLKFFDFSFVAVAPEPGSLALLALAATTTLIRRRRRATR